MADLLFPDPGYDAGQTAVIVPVPATEPIVGSWRQRFDRSAPYNVPAHITIIFPFVPFPRLSDTDLFDLRSLFAQQQPIDVTFADFGRFPTVLWLDPSPSAPFTALTRAMARRWPEAPPYGGIHQDNIVHLTVTETAGEADIGWARAEIGPKLPIVATLTSGVLLRFDGSRWLTEHELPFRE